MTEYPMLKAVIMAGLEVISAGIIAAAISWLMDSDNFQTTWLWCLVVVAVTLGHYNRIQAEGR